MPRDPAFERELLDHVARQAAHSGAAGKAFMALVSKRLQDGAAEYGDENFWRIGVEEVLSEAEEEGLDIGGWILGAIQVINDEAKAGKVDPDTAHSVKVMLMHGAAFGLQAWAAIASAKSIYRDAAGS